MPNREQFEAAYRKIYPATYPTITPNAFERDHDGYYIRTPIQEAWAWWQAGAAAEQEACAKLCDDIDTHCERYDIDRAFNSSVRRAAKAIRDRSAP